MSRVIRETNSYMIVYKPAGLPTETKAFGRRSLETETQKYLRETDQGGSNYLALINRLDQPVEGLVLLAKTKRAAAALSEELRTGQIQKEYLAVTAYGNPEEYRDPEPTGWTVLRDYLLKDGRTNTTSVVKKGTPGARAAALEYCAAAGGKDGRRLLRIRLLTGRHHQIRVQLAHAGYPILGDRKYGTREADQNELLFPALCAWRLKFRDPDTGQEINVKIPPENPAFTEYREQIERI